jgi:hypothetical protein
MGDRRAERTNVASSPTSQPENPWAGLQPAFNSNGGLAGKMAGWASQSASPVTCQVILQYMYWRTSMYDIPNGDSLALSELKTPDAPE